ncbi:enoyl-CoA hydratase-related protein [Thalassospiraceae bacterium LMO-SO8]|nr:enoyl-CoA hydratase-related protein [Alphaproteobacteria bacterium LMO-S08]WND75784.1 enoyl-CoA hydratase-related protein [Thalassospiraceae bacterium LMO-SO8]
MADEPVLLEIDARGVATVTLNRPDVNNAYDDEMIAALLNGVKSLSVDDRVRLVVLRGAGKHFQAGANLKWLKRVAGEGPEQNLQASRDTEAVVRLLDICPKPTVAVVQGFCVGGGTGVIAACDVVIAASDATFSISEVRWGLIPQPILPQLIAAMGSRNVRRYALTAERFSADQANNMGLVHEVAPPMQLERTAEKTIEAFLRSGPDAVAQTKAKILELAETSIDEATAEDLARLHSEKRQSAEASEGLTAFLEKRNPSWFKE